MLGIAASARAYAGRRFWIVRDAGRPVGAALRTPPFNLVLARPEGDAALDALVATLAGEELPGVTAAQPEAEAFAARWCERHDATRRVTMAQGIYQLENVATVPRPPGGRRFCFVYTDLANPTANAVYERIGYVRVCDSAEIAFG